MLEISEDEMTAFIEAIPTEKIQYKYGFGKWTVVEVLQHIIPYESIMLERAQVIAGTAIRNSEFVIIYPLKGFRAFHSSLGVRKSSNFGVYLLSALLFNLRYK